MFASTPTAKEPKEEFSHHSTDWKTSKESKTETLTLGEPHAHPSLAGAHCGNSTAPPQKTPHKTKVSWEATKRSAPRGTGACVSSPRIPPALLAGRLRLHAHADALCGVSPAAFPTRHRRPKAPSSALSEDFYKGKRLSSLGAGRGGVPSRWNPFWNGPTRNLAARPPPSGKLCWGQLPPRQTHL